MPSPMATLVWASLVSKAFVSPSPQIARVWISLATDSGERFPVCTREWARA